MESSRPGESGTGNSPSLRFSRIALFLPLNLGSAIWRRRTSGLCVKRGDHGTMGGVSREATVFKGRALFERGRRHTLIMKKPISPIRGPPVRQIGLSSRGKEQTRREGTPAIQEVYTRESPSVQKINAPQKGKKNNREKGCVCCGKKYGEGVGSLGLDYIRANGGVIKRIWGGA